MSSWKRTRVETDHITNGDEAKSSAMERAEKFQRNLPSEIPSFIKFMLPSHITGGFWLVSMTLQRRLINKEIIGC